MSEKCVLVTGAAGFIGYPSLAALRGRGYEVIAIGTRERAESTEGVRWVVADLKDREAVSALVSTLRPSHLLHFAWYAEPGKFWNSAENFEWVKSSLNLLQSCAEFGCSRIVTAGTCAEYDWSHGRCVEGETPLAPGTIYGTCKSSLQAMQRALSAEAGISEAWGRVFHCYGPREHPARLVPTVINALLGDEPARCSHGEQVRNFLHVDDVADAFAALLDSEVTGPVNIASGRPVQLRDVILEIADQLGRRDLVRLGAVAAAPGDPPCLLADTDRLVEEVGWRPSRDLHVGLRETIEWWRMRRDQERSRGADIG